MKERFWETQIDSDIGPLDIKVQYEVIPGQHGDYHTPTIHPEVSIVDIEIKPEQDFDPDVIKFLEEEIEDEIFNNQSSED
jgi:hypothetical protein